MLKRKKEAEIKADNLEELAKKSEAASDKATQEAQEKEQAEQAKKIADAFIMRKIKNLFHKQVKMAPSWLVKLPFRHKTFSRGQKRLLRHWINSQKC